MNPNRILVHFLFLFIFSLFLSFANTTHAGLVTLGFDNQSVQIDNPSNYAIPNTPFSLINSSGAATVRLPMGADSALWIFRNSFGWNGAASLVLTDGGTFDLYSFVAESLPNTSNIRIESYLSGSLITAVTFTSLGLKNVSANTGFQGIDELRVIGSSNLPGVVAADTFVFGIVPEPSALSLSIASLLVIVCKRRQ